jgi:hypothetical protein
VDEELIKRGRRSLLGCARAGVVQMMIMAVEQLDGRFISFVVCVIEPLADELQARGSGYLLSVAECGSNFPKDKQLGADGSGLYSERNKRRGV